MLTEQGLSTGALKDWAGFCADNGLSRTQAYYLQVIGRGPRGGPGQSAHGSRMWLPDAFIPHA